jgi:hypothetical protein
MRRYSGAPVFGDETLDHRDDLIGVAGAPDAHGERFAGVFVDDVQQFDPPVVGGLVELEVQRPHLVRPLGAQQLTTTAWAGSLPAARRRPAQPLVSPQPSGALTGHRPTLPAHDRVRGLPPPPRMPPRDLPQPATQLLLLGRRGRAGRR